MTTEGIPDWAQTLPEELHDSPHLKGSESVSQWVDHLKNDSAWRGQSIRIPAEGADEGAMQDFYGQLQSKVPGLMPTPVDDETTGTVYSQLGKPETATGYKVPEGMESIDGIDGYKEVAHSLDMTQRVFTKWLEMEKDGSKERTESQREALDAGYTDLRKEWGTAYEDRYSKVGDVLRDAPPTIVQAYKDNLLPPDQVRWLHSLVELAAEPTEIEGQQGKGLMTPEQASLELEEFKPVFYAMKKNDPGYKAAKAKVERLIRMRLGEVA